MVFVVVQFSATMSSLLIILLVISSSFYLVLFKVLLNRMLLILRLAIACNVLEPSVNLILFPQGQISLFIALPVGYQGIAFITLAIMALLFRILDVLYLTWKQSNVDIFLMDWERPKGMILPANQNAESDTSKAIPTPVSIWRTYFVANEWNEIQSLRKMSPTLVLMTVVFFLEAVGIKHLAEEAPTGHVTVSDERYSAPHSRALRFALATLLYGLFAVVLVSVNTLTTLLR